MKGGDSGSRPRAHIDVGAEGFLSVDVEAQLRKLPSRSFRSAHHYPVELVRGAVGRGSKRVDVRITRRAVEVSDDGNPVARELLDYLCSVVDPGRTDQVRQDALAYFEEGNGLELLACMAPFPEEVVIETGRSGSRTRTVLRRGLSPLRETIKQGPALRDSGTSIAILRRGNRLKERDAVADYCGFARASVTLNGRAVSLSRPPEAVAFSDLKADGEFSGGKIWIPPGGDTCRVWLLRHGVRWRQAVYPPRSGLVFHCALEAHSTPRPETMTRMKEAAETLYRLLSKRYRGLPPQQRTRVEELIFLHFRHEGRTKLSDDFAPFRLLGGDRPLSLGQVVAEAEAGELRVLSDTDRVDRYDTRGGPVLVVSSRQREFLAQQVGLPLSAPPLRERSRGMLKSVIRRFFEGLLAALARMRAKRLKAVKAGDLTQDEKRLLDEVGEMLDSHRFRLPFVPAGAYVEVFMVERAGRKPAVVLRKQRSASLVLFRRNRLVRSSAKAVADDPANIRMVMALLTDGHDGRRP